MDEPKFSRELADTALLCLKILLAVGVPFALLALIAKTHPWLALGLMYAAMLGGIIFFGAHMNYKWKKKDWERQKRDEEREREWKEA